MQHPGNSCFRIVIRIIINVPGLILDYDLPFDRQIHDIAADVALFDRRNIIHNKRLQSHQRPLDQELLRQKNMALRRSRTD